MIIEKVLQTTFPFSGKKREKKNTTNKTKKQKKFCLYSGRALYSKPVQIWVFFLQSEPTVIMACYHVATIITAMVWHHHSTSLGAANSYGHRGSIVLCNVVRKKKKNQNKIRNRKKNRLRKKHIIVYSCRQFKIVANTSASQ